ncbi:hypothetical protein OG982_06080 [Streptomyces sp. NBC_01551]|uniref:hypothetical protein n=1 Tax=Streptomyces sp. NBC_01551 TaxID=2975876 RepID=UPI0022597746|nr:hypothetical protein [Streptomyces sp. NBC_01551]MCX4525261.1 hypothetical protein [Streptomyces sp. NBC_01551]
MAGERIWTVILGAAVRERAVQAAAEARTAGCCGHVGAIYVSAAAPSAGTWCVDCGHRPLGDLLLTPWCLLCDGIARPGITQARAGGLEILLRTCDHCLTADSPRT